MFDGLLTNNTDINKTSMTALNNIFAKHTQEKNNSFVINLLPWRVRKRFKDFKHYLFLILLFGLILSVLCFVLVRYHHSSNLKLQDSLKLLQHEKLELESQLSAVSKQMQSIKNYQRLAKRYKEAQLMNSQLLNSLKSIADILPENSWLTHLAYQNSKWQFTGMSYLTEEIELFMAELRKNEQFSDIALERVIQQLPKLNELDGLPSFSFSFGKQNKQTHLSE